VHVPRQDLAFLSPMSWPFLIINELRWEVIVHFVDFVVIVYHHCWNFLFLIIMNIHTFISSSWIDLSDSYNSDSNGSPVILSGPFGINSTVNLYWTTNSPTKIINNTSWTTGKSQVFLHLYQNSIFKISRVGEFLYKLYMKSTYLNR
jgi:hypothetical protein